MSSSSIAITDDEPPLATKDHGKLVEDLRDAGRALYCLPDRPLPLFDKVAERSIGADFDLDRAAGAAPLELNAAVGQGSGGPRQGALVGGVDVALRDIFQEAVGGRNRDGGGRLATVGVPVVRQPRQFVERVARRLEREPRSRWR